MPTLKIDETKVEFLNYLQKLFKDADSQIDPLRAYSKYEITLIKSTSKSKKAKVKIYGAFIKAK